MNPYRSLEYARTKVAPGWYEIIDNLVADLTILGWNGDVRQVGREHGGELLFRVGVHDEAIRKRIYRAKRESECTCENCGDRGRHGLCSGCATLPFPCWGEP